MTNISEHYLALRTQAHELRHQRELDEHVNRRAPSLGVEGAVREYFTQFELRVIESNRQYQADLAQLREDLPRLTPQERFERESQLVVPVYPAWSEKDEAGYLRTYGDPREDSALFSQIQILSAPVWNEVIDNRPVQRTKTPWELTVFDALVHPRDGSVPLFPLDADGNPIINTTALMFGRPMERARMVTRDEPGVGVEDLYNGQNGLGGSLAGAGWQPPQVATVPAAGAGMPAMPAAPAVPAMPSAQPPQSVQAQQPDIVASVLDKVPVPENASPRYLRKMADVAALAMRSLCPHCLDSFPRGLPNHAANCIKNPESPKAKKAAEALKAKHTVAA